MVRVVLYLFVAIILISVVRSIAGVLAKGFSSLIEPDKPPPAAGEPRNVGELKRDPVCGTYVSAATSLKKTVGGDVVHFCSKACLEKYRRPT